MVPTSTYDEEYLSSLRAVRERCFKVQEAAVKNKTHHFDVDTNKFQDMVQFVIAIIKRDYDNPSEIPAHGRWRHFDIGGKPRIQTLINSWTSLGTDATEKTRRILDLFVIAVLVDIDPGQGSWSFRDPSTQRLYKRREGVAVALFNMFMTGVFSNTPNQPHRVDSESLRNLTMNTLLEGLQITNAEQWIGLEDRLELLNHLGELLQRRSDYFGGKDGSSARPGNMMDYILSHPTTINTKKGPLIRLETFWPIIMEMGELWTVQQERECRGGSAGLGDVWLCPALGDNQFVAFHKLSQWMVYSLIEPMEKLLGATIEGKDQLTPLPDYSNGGLLIDTGFITLKQKDYERGIKNYRENSLLPGQPKIEVTPMFDMSDPVVVEWRALTVAYLDMVAERVRSKLRLSKKTLSLTQLIEGGTSSAGKELAEISRPNTQNPPIMVKSEKKVIF